MSANKLVGNEKGDVDIGMHGAEDDLGHSSNVGFCFRQQTTVVTDDQVVLALLGMLQRSQSMLTESTSEESLHFETR